MDYPVFSPQGPQVSVNLFGEAAQAGAKLGQAIPNPITSVIQGGEEGYKFFQDRQKEQAQIETEQSQAKIQKATEDAKILRDNAVYGAEAQKADSYLDLASQQDAFYQETKDASPQEIAKTVLSGKYNQVFANNPKLFNQQLESIYANPDSGLDPSTQDRIGKILKVSRVTDYRDRQKEQYLDKFNGAKSQLFEEPYIANAAEKLGVTPEEAASNTDLVPHGSLLDDNGALVPDIKGGGWLKNPKYNAEAAKGAYDVIDRSTGQILDNTGSVGTDSYKKRSNYLLTKGMVNGAYAKRDIEQLNEKPVNTENSAPVSIPGFSQETKPTEEAVSTDTLLQKPWAELGQGVAKAVNINPKTLIESAGTPLYSLQEQIKSYVGNPLKRGSAEFLTQHSTTLNELTRSITDTQFNNSTALQAQYTDSHVNEYNNALMKSLGRKASYGIAGSLFSADTSEIEDAYKVTTPQDLYYAKQHSVVQASINNYINSIITSLQNRKNSVGNGLKASSATATYLAGVAQSGPAR